MLASDLERRAQVAARFAANALLDVGQPALRRRRTRGAGAPSRPAAARPRRRAPRPGRSPRAAASRCRTQSSREAAGFPRPSRRAAAPEPRDSGRRSRRASRASFMRARASGARLIVTLKRFAPVLLSVSIAPICACAKGANFASSTPRRSAASKLLAWTRIRMICLSIESSSNTTSRSGGHVLRDLGQHVEGGEIAARRRRGTRRARWPPSPPRAGPGAGSRERACPGNASRPERSRLRPRPRRRGAPRARVEVPKRDHREQAGDAGEPEGRAEVAQLAREVESHARTRPGGSSCAWRPAPCRAARARSRARRATGEPLAARPATPPGVGQPETRGGEPGALREILVDAVELRRCRRAA